MPCAPKGDRRMKDCKTDDGDGDHRAFENHEHGLIAAEEGAIETTCEFSAPVDGTDEYCEG